MEEQKQNIIAGARQYSDYIVRHIPQRDENGNVKYYFSGSLAMLLLSSAVSVKSSFLDEKGMTIRDRQEFCIPDNNTDSLLHGVRAIGLDVDIVVVDDKTFVGRGGIYNLKTIRENCSLATELCPKWTNTYGTAYFDLLADERTFEGHDIAELTMQDGAKVIIADPLCLAIHKFADGIACLIQIKKLSSKGILKPETELKYLDKYQKDIRDFTSMFNGVVSLYKDVDFKQVVKHVLETCPETTFSGIMFEDSRDDIEQFYFDAKKQIDDKHQSLFGDFIEAIEKQNKSILVKRAKDTPTKQ